MIPHLRYWRIRDGREGLPDRRKRRLGGYLAKLTRSLGTTRTRRRQVAVADENRSRSPSTQRSPPETSIRAMSSHAIPWKVTPRVLVVARLDRG